MQPLGSLRLICNIPKLKSVFRNSSRVTFREVYDSGNHQLDDLFVSKY